MTTATTPWFPAAQQPALHDFWAVYSAHFANAALDAAAEGDWATYEASLRSRGAAFVRNGVSLTEALERVRDFAGPLQPLLIAAYAPTPDRLARVLEVLRVFIDQTTAVVGQVYLDEQSTVVGAPAPTDASLAQAHASILETALDGIVTTDRRGVVLLWNRAAEKILGHSRDQAVGHSFAELSLPGQVDPLLGPDVEGLLDQRMEQVVRRADGTELPVEIVVTRQVFELGTLLFTRFIRDISDHRNARRILRLAEEKSRRLGVEVARAALRNSEERFRLLIEGVEDYAIFMLNPEGRISSWNAGAERISGYSAIEIIGKPFSGFYLVDEIAAGRPLQDLNAAATKGRFEAEGWKARKDGSLLWSTMVITALRDPAGALRGFAIVARDITERRLADQKMAALTGELMNRASQLEVLNKELEAFSYSVSHDLRGPLRALDGFSQLLLEDYSATLDTQGRNYLTRIRAASQKMGQLIDDLLKLSRLSRGEIQFRPVDLSAAVERIAADLRESEPAREVDIEIEPGLKADADPQLMDVALRNLMGNAWKFTSKRTRASIRFGSCMQGGQRAYFVQDDGAGFDMAYAGQLFGAFQRLHSVAEFDGNGIGLATVRRIINRHGGDIWAQGQVGTGATFFFTLTGGTHA